MTPLSEVSPPTGRFGPVLPRLTRLGQLALLGGVPSPSGSLEAGLSIPPARNSRTQGGGPASGRLVRSCVVLLVCPRLCGNLLLRLLSPHLRTSPLRSPPSRPPTVRHATPFVPGHLLPERHSPPRSPTTSSSSASSPFGGICHSRWRLAIVTP